MNFIKESCLSAQYFKDFLLYIAAYALMKKTFLKVDNRLLMTEKYMKSLMPALF
jgi:hypothetical protein